MKNKSDRTPANRGAAGPRQKYLKSKSGALPGFAALLGEQFGARVNLLAQLIGTAHYPSLGAYKERLLMEVIRQYIPKRYSVGTGFTLFPRQPQFTNIPPKDFDFGNTCQHSPSHQCDILVYDSWSHPVIFQDGDFVVLRPEALRAIVEVKGSLDHKGLKQTLSDMITFGQEWKRCSEFYQKHYQTDTLHIPGLFLLAWQTSVDKSGRDRITGVQVREMIVNCYSTRLVKEEIEGLPLLRSAYVYNSYIVSQISVLKDKEISFGYRTHRGQSKRYTPSGKLQVVGDMTIADLLAYIQHHLDVPFNRFYSYVDQASSVPEDGEHPHFGYTPWLQGAEDVRMVR